MKRQKKKLLGFFGLSFVVAMTSVAAIIPGPETSAVASVTDTIQVRVVSSVPNAKFKEPDQNIVTAHPEHSIFVTYENVTSVKIKMKYKHPDGSLDEYDFAYWDNLNYEAGERGTNIDFSNYGYGEFIFSLYGVGQEGNEIEFDEVLIEYVPIIVGPVTQNEDGKVTTRIEEYDDDVETVDIYIGDKLIKTVNKDELDDEIELPMDGYESGTYNVTFVARDEDDDQLYTPTQKPLRYTEEEEIPVPGTADTGHFFQNLNISKEDYIITGLIVFFVFGVVAFGIVARGNNRNRSHKKKR